MKVASHANSAAVTLQDPPRLGRRITIQAGGLSELTISPRPFPVAAKQPRERRGRTSNDRIATSQCALSTLGGFDTSRCALSGLGGFGVAALERLQATRHVC